MLNATAPSSARGTSPCQTAPSPVSPDKPLSSLAVLIIDDEVDMSDALVRLLGLEGFHVECVATGHDGIERALSKTLDAIVLDLHLPDILGLTVLSEVRRAGLLIPVIVVTGWYLGTGHETAARALGASFMRKPLDVSQLAASILEAVSSNAASHTSAARIESLCGDLIHPPAAARDHQRPAQTDTLWTLHQNAVAGDASAIDQITARQLETLRWALERGFRTAAHEWIDEAVVDALMEYRSKPARFDPTRGLTLHSYLLWAARRNLQNVLDRERRRSAREISAADPELFEQPPPARADRISREDVARAIAGATADFTEVERRFVRLRLDGERRTEMYARAGGFSHLPLREQRVLAKQIKDRILQRLRRYRSSFSQGGPK